MSETLNVKRSERRSASPSTWTCDRLAGETGSERQTWRRLLSPRSVLGRPSDCGASFRSPSPWIYCGNRAETLRLSGCLSGSLSGTCARSNGSGTSGSGNGTSGSGNGTLICGIRSGTCEAVICFLQTSFQTSSGNGCGPCCCENETCRTHKIWLALFYGAYFRSVQITDRERDLERLLELLLLRLPWLLLRERRRLRDLWMCQVLEMSGFFKNSIWSGTKRLLPGAAAGVRPSPAGSVLHQPNLPSIDVRTVQLIQSPLHVRVRPKLNNALVCAFLMGIGISHFPCLTHEVLKIKTEKIQKGCSYIHILKTTQPWPGIVGIPWDLANYSGWIGFPQQGDTLCEPEVHTCPCRCGSGCCNHCL